MRRATTFDEAILNNVNHNFAIRIVHKSYMKVDLCVPQYKIASTLQNYLDNKPKRIDLYWSSAPVYNVIIEDLNSQNLNDFERLELLTRRCPWIYAYSFHPRKNNNE